MKTLTPGANAPLEDDTTIEVRGGPSGQDISALVIYGDGRVRGDGDMAFYNQTSIHGGAVVLEGGRMRVDPDRLPAEAEKVVLVSTIEKGTFGSGSDIDVILTRLKAHIPAEGRTERALILIEIYRRNGAWKIRCVGQGFEGGLADLAAHFGIEVAQDQGAAPASAPDPAPAPATSVNLSKVSLTKERPAISLDKAGGGFGRILVNLDWSRAQGGGGFFSGPKEIDLDLGAFVESRDGRVTAVQALGDTMGRYDGFPFTRLLDDDRTGAVEGGEWLEINGDHWNEIERILIYAFIYEGAPNWAKTDAVIRVTAPGQPEIEVRPGDLGSKQPMCAIALLTNESGRLQLMREGTFHRGHAPMDNAYRWGMSWRPGRK